jgi:CheY-like chemotaxis protein
MNSEAPNRIDPAGRVSFRQAEPVVALDDVAPRAEEQIAEPPGSPETYRVLLVDDTPAIHEDFRKILSDQEPTALDLADRELFGTPATPKLQKRFTVHSAYQGQEALACVERGLKEGQRYSLVFLDVRMPPGWDGIETLSHLWKADPDLQVVICTAYSDYSWGQMCEKFGGTDSLVVLKSPSTLLKSFSWLTRSPKWQLSREAKQRLEVLDAIVAQKTKQLRNSNDELLREVAERKAAEARTQAFSTLGQKLSATKTAQNAAQIIADTAGGLIDWDKCAVELYCAEDDSLERLLSVDRVGGECRHRSSEGQAQTPSPFTRLAIEKGGQLFTEVEIAELANESLPLGAEGRVASMLVVPIRNHQSVIGALGSKLQGQCFHGMPAENIAGARRALRGALDRIRTEEELHRTQEQLRQSQNLRP